MPGAERRSRERALTLRGKPWTEEHTATLRDLAPFAYDHEIASVTGHCVDTVQRRRSALGIPPYRGIPVRIGTLEEIRERLTS